jgi:hypothetical protein
MVNLSQEILFTKWVSVMMWFSGAIRRPLLRAIVALPLALVGAALAAPARADSGRVLDWATHQPVAGARMVLDCSGDPWFQVEGAVHLRTVVHVTDSDGRYSFSRLDKLGCTQIAFWGEKDGYIGTDAALTGAVNIPAIAYLIKTTDRVMFDLEHLVPSSGRTLMQKDGSLVPDPYGEYLDVYRSFFKAKRIATSAREAAFVHEHFCERLVTLYVRLSDEQKSALAKYDVPSFNYANQFTRGGSYADYEGEVVPYCI